MCSLFIFRVPAIVYISRRSYRLAVCYYTSQKIIEIESDEEFVLSESGSDSEPDIESSSQEDEQDDHVDIPLFREYVPIDARNPAPERPRFDFLGTPKVNIALPDDASALDYFSYFWPNDIMEEKV